MSATEQALTRLGDVTADAMVEVLELVAPESTQRGAVRLLAGSESVLEGVAAPVLACSVNYVDGVTGGNLLLLSLQAARRLAATMMGETPPERDDSVTELSETEASAIAEATNQVMATAASAVSGVLGAELEIAPPEIELCASAEALAALPALQSRAPHVVRTSVRVCDEPAWIVQHVPSALAVRLSASADQAEDVDVDVAAAADGPAPVLSDVSMRVWAELGRAQMPAAAAAGLPSGAVVELDRRPEDPIDVYVNGRRFAVGQLVVDGAEWAVRIDVILSPEDPDTSLKDVPWPASS